MNNTDTVLLDWWERNLNVENSTDSETGEVVLHRVIGNVNDRVWSEIGRGETLRDAIRAARAHRRADKKGGK